MPIYSLGSSVPKIAPKSWIAPSAQVIGQAEVDDLANIWFNAVVRADVAPIKIGKGTNIQDGSVLHIDAGDPLIIEPYVTVGHLAMLHSCTIGEGSLIGMNATLLSRSRIGRNSLVGAGALVTEGKVFPDGVLILGSPAKIVRELTDEEIKYINNVAHDYIKKSQHYSQEMVKIDV